jgi:death-on-curing family protein
MDEIVIYKGNDNQIELSVQFEGDTVWLNQQQMAQLFNQTKQNISLHINNIFKEGELKQKSVVKESLTTAQDGKKYSTKFYNLDVIISVGYRVKSIRGTQFRQWATKRLKEYMIEGYSINQKRLSQLQKVVEVIAKSGNLNSLQLSETKGLLEILSNYTRSFILLSQYDNSKLKSEKLNLNITYEIKYKEAKAAILELKSQLIAKKQASELFGNEKDNGFKSSLKAIVQTFDGHYLYPSIEEQAAHLLYFIIQNHSFSDGNKRIGAFLFIWFLEKNKHRLKKSGEVKINDNGLIALALLVAQSNPQDKELMIQLIINLINEQ